MCDSHCGLSVLVWLSRYQLKMTIGIFLDCLDFARPLSGTHPHTDSPFHSAQTYLEL